MIRIWIPIAPRRLAIIAGELDEIFPMYGVEEGFETVQKVYEAERLPTYCRLVKTPKGHWWCEDIVWGVVKEETEKMGW